MGKEKDKGKESVEVDGEDLEIVSMGALCRRDGQWEKKYWSCSRGKDRYPYPVGYQAVRHHSGNSYRMEIQEGPKGPLFRVASTDGGSSTGQTPDIAWKNFQRKSGPKVKNWHGRRLSSKIDGAELFGFRNLAVQRLLRELLVDANGAIERSSSCPNTYNAALHPNNKVETESSDAHQDLPVCSDKARSGGKRSMEPSKEEGGAKRIYCQDPLTSVDDRLGNEDLESVAHRNSQIDEGGPRSSTKLMDTNNCSSSKCADPIPEEVSCIAPDNGTFEGLVRDSCQQVRLSSESSNPSSEKADLDSAEQEVAKSMMAFLLPQAIPLLKKTYARSRSKQKRKVGPEYAVSTKANSAALVGIDHPCSENCEGEVLPQRLVKGSQENNLGNLNNSRTSVQVSLLCEMVKVESTKDCCPNSEPFSNLEVVKAVVSDSFEGDAEIRDANTHKPLPAYHHKPDEVCSNELNKDSSKLAFSTRDGDAEPSKYPFGRCEGSGGGGMPNDHEKSEFLLTDSLVAYLEEEYNNELLGEEESSPCPEPSNQGNDCAEHMQALYPMFPRHEGLRQFNDPLNAPNKEFCIPMDIPKHKNFGNGMIEHCAQTPIGHDHRASRPRKFSANIRGQSHIINSDAHNETEKMATTTGELKSYLLSVAHEALSTEVLSSNDHKENKFIGAHRSPGNYATPLSESIICRSFDGTKFFDKFVTSDTSDKGENCIAGFSSYNTMTRMSIDSRIKEDKHKPPDNGERCQTECTDGSEKTRVSIGSEMKAGEHIPPLENLDIIYPSEPAVLASTCTSQEIVKNVSSDMKSSESHVLSHSYFEDNYNGSFQEDQNNYMMQLKKTMVVAQQRRNENLKAFPFSNVDPVTHSTRENSYKDLYDDRALSCRSHLNGLSSERAEPLIRKSDSSMELMGCYLHPEPVLSIVLNTKDGCLNISVLCGLLENCERSLYIYSIAAKERHKAPPYFIGYTSIVLPSLEQSSKRFLSLGGSGLQFTPGGQFLVLLNSIKTPSCRSRNINCLCSSCKLDQCDDNAVKIVSVNFGYVSLLTKLMAYEKVSCILVCEPNYIIAVEDRGNLHVWIMNSGWSSISEEFMVPRSDYMGPSILELRGIPKSSSLVLGHDGIGGFCLWDISKQAILATFTAPGNILFQILPVGFCSLQEDIVLLPLDDIEKRLKGMTTDDRPSKTSREYCAMSPGEDVAVWLLVSAASVTEFQHDFRMKVPNTRWRLALLAKEMVFMGNVLDPRASAIDASGNYGFAGTYEGLLYKWELSSGKKLANTQCFKCGSVSCVAVDAKSGAMAVADDKCQLLLYAETRMADQ